MKFLKIEDDKLIFYTPLSKCRNCHKKMVYWHWSFDIPKAIRGTVKSSEIVIEAYGESGVCTTCVSAGGFMKSCDCCDNGREFPKEFKYQITHYANYPEEDTEFEYICKECIKNNQTSVIEMLAKSDDTIDLESEKR